MRPYQEALLEIYGSVSRKKANFDIAKAPAGSEVHSSPGVRNEFSLIAGSYRAIQGHGGFIALGEIE